MEQNRKAKNRSKHIVTFSTYLRGHIKTGEKAVLLNKNIETTGSSLTEGRSLMSSLNRFQNKKN